ncbi:family 43 glycosylhydrolase [Sphingomonas piscis]|uniref:Family 43 glycosylhydrolase n=1 Tax=Sphingomonas piscis TaxID=2714943 RepID=A0A6G7YNL0_9SPHN|nr:glycoside hydrolase family 43 protein [Sphingomonas piscis]QIK78317.1 family 43 glycosylhydrolase [Sphingomonas piscis]
MFRAAVLSLAGVALATPAAARPSTPGSNPIIRDRFTADPAPLVRGNRLYLYVGHDEARGKEMFNMREWLAYSTTDMRHWTFHGPIMKATDFKWASKDAWASQMVFKNGKYYFYAAVEHDKTHPGKAIAIAVSDSPTGPFKDARGSALVYNQMTPQGPHTWDDIDPTVWTEGDGTSWLIWGNAKCYIAKLKPNMVELDGPIREMNVPRFEEGPWIHKRKGIYYLTYASIDKKQGPDERIAYATAPKIAGPWTFRGDIMASGKNSFTIHPGIAEFKGKWYMFYHDASLTIGDEKGALGRRAVRIEPMYYNPDGTIRPIPHTDAGVTASAKR